MSEAQSTLGSVTFEFLFICSEIVSNCIEVAITSSQMYSHLLSHLPFIFWLASCEPHIVTEYSNCCVTCRAIWCMEGHVCEKRCFNLRAIAATSPAPLPLPSSANKSLNWKRFLMWVSFLHGQSRTQSVVYLSNCQELKVKDNLYRVYKA